LSFLGFPRGSRGSGGFCVCHRGTRQAQNCRLISVVENSSSQSAHRRRIVVEKAVAAVLRKVA
jgi:hypothetical protein